MAHGPAIPIKTKSPSRNSPRPIRLDARPRTDEKHPDLRPLPSGVGKRTVAGTRAAVRTVIRYRDGVLNGRGASLLDGYMEDLATDRIYRLMIAQRMQHSDRVEDSRRPGRGGSPHARVHHFTFRRRAGAPVCASFRQDPSPQAAASLREARRISEQMISHGEFTPSLKTTEFLNATKPIKETTHGRIEERKQTDTNRTKATDATGHTAIVLIAACTPNHRAGHGIVRPYSRRRSSAVCAVPYTSNTLSRASAPNVSGISCTPSLTSTRSAPSPAIRRSKWSRPGLQAIYASGWQVAADNNTAGDVYPDQSLYPMQQRAPNLSSASIALSSAPIKSTASKAASGTYWFAPIVADAEAGFGGSLNAYELMKSMIEAGAAGVHFEDQLSSAKKCGHLGGKVVVPTREFIEKLTAARLAADVCGVPTILVARTDANSAGLLLSDADPRDREFIHGERTAEGFFQFRGGIDAAIARGLAYAPYADMLWCETSKPDLAEARQFADAIHAKFPGKLLAYNCSPSFNWKQNLDDATIADFQQELGEMGYKFQFVTLAGFHSLNLSIFELAQGYRASGMTAYTVLQQREFAAQTDGYRAVKHQSFVGTGYFDHITQVVSGGHSSTQAMEGSTEAAQFDRYSEKTAPAERPRAAAD